MYDWRIIQSTIITENLPWTICCILIISYQWFLTSQQNHVPNLWIQVIYTSNIMLKNLVCWDLRTIHMSWEQDINSMSLWHFSRQTSNYKRFGNYKRFNQGELKSSRNFRMWTEFTYLGNKDVGLSCIS